MSEARPLDDGWLPDTPVDDTIMRRFLFNQADLNALIARVSGGRTDRTDDVALADAGGPVAYFNQAVLLRHLRGPEDPVLDRVDEFYAASAGPATLLSLWPTGDLSSRGWSLMGHPAFVARPPGPHERRDREGVEIRTVESAADLLVAERVLVEGYPMHEAGGQSGSVLPPGLIGTEVVTRIGCVDGHPAGTAVQYVAHGTVNLCSAATLPSARRRGVWEELVWARVDTAPDLPAVAYTSDYSRPGFIRMGFLPIVRFTLWHRTAAV